jgi:hypothetical protein
MATQQLCNSLYPSFSRTLLQSLSLRLLILCWLLFLTPVSSCLCIYQPISFLKEEMQAYDTLLSIPYLNF